MKEQKVKAEEAKAQASNLQCQLDEMRGATSVDDSALMEEEVATLREEFEKIKKQELMCWMAETGSQMAVPGVSAGISITGGGGRVQRWMIGVQSRLEPRVDWSPESRVQRWMIGVQSRLESRVG